MPVVTCGGMRYQHSWNDKDRITAASQRNVEACVERALDLGINHFETARGYGTSERQLGHILPRLSRERLIVQTKVNPNEDPKKFAKIFETSMKRLRLDYLDLFAFHGINNDECLENTFRCMDLALRWKEEGRIRHIGFATHGPTDVIVKAVKTGAFEYVNLHWYWIFQDNWPAIREARKRDMGVFIISPNDKAGMLYKPSDRLVALTSPLHPMAFNLLFCLSKPEVHTLSVGVSRPEDFDIHVNAVSDRAGWDQTVERIDRRLKTEMGRVLGKEWAKSWQVGLPEWHETPGQMNIPWILRLRNLALAFGMTEFAKMRYNLLGQGGHWFPGNRADNLSRIRPAKLMEALKRSPHAAVIPGLLKETHKMLVGKKAHRLQKG